MERVQRIWSNLQYQRYLEDNRQAEAACKFCKHDMEHNLAVARIAYMLWLEQGGSSDSKVLFYTAALLHDIGKGQGSLPPQTDHAVRSAALAGEILSDCGFTPEEQSLILGAIAEHSGRDRWQEISRKEQKSFAEIFYLADKLSRPCWQCEAREECYWQVKNLSLQY